MDSNVKFFQQIKNKDRLAVLVFLGRSCIEKVVAILATNLIL
jgi:hypothetical protein